MRMADIVDFTHEIEIEVSDTNHDLYRKISDLMSRNVSSSPLAGIRIWKVGTTHMPTIVVSDNSQQWSVKDEIIYVQTVCDRREFLQKG